MGALAVKIGTVTITEPFTVQQTWETASNFTMHEVQPGTYDVTATTGMTSKMVMCKVDTIVRQHYYVNRVFSASSAHDEHPNTPGHYVFQTYEYAAAEAATVGAPGKWDSETGTLIPVTPKLFGGEFRLDEGVVVTVQHIVLHALSENDEDRHHTSRGFSRMPSATCPATTWNRETKTRDACDESLFRVEFEADGRLFGCCKRHGGQYRTVTVSD